MPDDAPSYVLVAVAGMSPQVITETVWLLAHEPVPRLPAEVHVLTTVPGKVALDGGLFDRDTPGQPPFPYKGSHWEALADHLQAQLPEPVVHLVADGHGQPLRDITTKADTTHAATHTFDLVRRLTEQPLPVVALIAGGRKTMSGDLQTAFSVYARPYDRAVHVLVRPDTYVSGAFFFPTAEALAAETPPELDLVEVTVPKLRRFLETSKQGRFADLLAENASLHELLAEIERWSLPAPASFDVLLPEAGGACTLVFHDNHGHEIGQTTLQAETLATLLTFIEAIGRGDGAVSLDALTDKPQTYDTLRRTVEALVLPGQGRENLAAWTPDETGRRSVSKKLNSLAEALNRSTYAAPATSFALQRRTVGGARTYAWKHTPPKVQRVIVPPSDDAHSRRLRLDMKWPFQHVPTPTAS